MRGAVAVALGVGFLAGAYAERLAGDAVERAMAESLQETAFEATDFHSDMLDSFDIDVEDLR